MESSSKWTQQKLELGSIAVVQKVGHLLAFMQLTLVQSQHPIWSSDCS